jgi:hypothetical protein
MGSYIENVLSQRPVQILAESNKFLLFGFGNLQLVLQGEGYTEMFVYLS